MVIGSRIKKLREAKGLSQQIVADQLGMTQANYHKLESDKTKLKIETLERLAEFYDVSILDLLESDRNVFNIKNNTLHDRSVNGIVIQPDDPEKIELLREQLKAKDEIIKLKDEKIAWLENKIQKS